MYHVSHHVWENHITLSCNASHLLSNITSHHITSHHITSCYLIWPGMNTPYCYLNPYNTLNPPRPSTHYLPLYHILSHSATIGLQGSLWTLRPPSVHLAVFTIYLAGLHGQEKCLGNLQLQVCHTNASLIGCLVHEKFACVYHSSLVTRHSLSSSGIHFVTLCSIYFSALSFRWVLPIMMR